MWGERAAATYHRKQGAANCARAKEGVAVLRASSTRANLQWNGVQGARQLHSHKSGGHCGHKSKEANPLQRLRAREQTHCTKKQKYPQGCSAVRAARDGPELSRVANRLVNLAGVPGR